MLPSYRVPLEASSAFREPFALTVAASHQGGRYQAMTNQVMILIPISSMTRTHQTFRLVQVDDKWKMLALAGAAYLISLHVHLLVF